MRAANKCRYVVMTSREEGAGPVEVRGGKRDAIGAGFGGYEEGGLELSGGRGEC